MELQILFNIMTSFPAMSLADRFTAPVTDRPGRGGLLGLHGMHGGVFKLFITSRCKPFALAID